VYASCSEIITPVGGSATAVASLDDNAILGARRPDQADGIIGAAEFRLTDNEIDEIETFMREYF
jgi:aryl-alcohol dehydrogenase-like predicted oxidoreductase